MVITFLSILYFLHVVTDKKTKRCCFCLFVFLFCFFLFFLNTFTLTVERRTMLIAFLPRLRRDRYSPTLLSRLVNK